MFTAAVGHWLRNTTWSTVTYTHSHNWLYSWWLPFLLSIPVSFLHFFFFLILGSIQLTKLAFIRFWAHTVIAFLINWPKFPDVLLLGPSSDEENTKNTHNHFTAIIHVSGCRVAQLVECLVTSGYPDGSSGKTHILQSWSTTVQR